MTLRLKCFYDNDYDNFVVGPRDITRIFRQTHEGDVVNGQYNEMNNHSNIVVLSPKCISILNPILIDSPTLLDPEECCLVHPWQHQSSL